MILFILKLIQHTKYMYQRCTSIYRVPYIHDGYTVYLCHYQLISTVNKNSMFMENIHLVYTCSIGISFLTSLISVRRTHLNTLLMVFVGTFKMQSVNMVFDMANMSPKSTTKNKLSIYQFLYAIIEGKQTVLDLSGYCFNSIRNTVDV